MHLNKKNQYNSQAGTTGYWDHPNYMQQIGRLKSFADELLHEEYQSLADVLVVYDTESIYHMPSTQEVSCPVTEQVINWSTLALYYSGCLFDQIHLDDLEKVELNKYKAIIFMNTFLLNEKEKSYIQSKVAGGDRHLVWIYAPGYINGKHAKRTFISEIIGINVDTFHQDKAPKLVIDDNFVRASSMEAKGKYAPVFYIKDKEARIFGFYKSKNLPGFGSKQLDYHKTWYAGIPITDYRIFQHIFKEAGVSLYAKEKDIIYGNNNWLLYHSINNGEKTINHLGKTFQIRFSTSSSHQVLKFEKWRNLVKANNACSYCFCNP